MKRDATWEQIRTFLLRWGRPIVSAKGLQLNRVDDDFDTRNFFLVITKAGLLEEQKILVTYVMAHDAMGSGGDAKLREHIEEKLYQCFPSQ